MKIPRWKPAAAYTPQERFLMSRVHRHRKLFGFLREHREALFDEAFQAELAGMYRRPTPGEAAPPAQLCMALLLQGYTGASDAEVVELSVVDLRWQMVLGCLGATTPAFSQGSLVNMRGRLMMHEMDRRLLERTRELARSTGAFDPKKLPEALRVAVDSSPLVGASKVEDTFNLLAHAGRNVAKVAASVLGRPFEEICEETDASFLRASRAKAALDINWSDEEQKKDALLRLMDHLMRVNDWVEEHCKVGPASPAVATLRALSSTTC